MKQTAAKTAWGASAVIDGMTTSMVKGATAGNLIAGTIKRVVERTRNWTIQAARMAAHESSMEASGRALAKAHGIATDTFQNVEAAGQNGNAPSRLATGARELRSAQSLQLGTKGQVICEVTSAGIRVGGKPREKHVRQAGRPIRAEFYHRAVFTSRFEVIASRPRRQPRRTLRFPHRRPR